MAEFLIVAEKSTQFQGTREEWSNTYYLTTQFAEAFDDAAAMNSILQLERAVHSNVVTFDQLTSYEFSLTGAQIARARINPNVTGLEGPLDGMYIESAVLCVAELPRSGVFGLGRRRYLRKWLHTCTLTQGGFPADGNMLSGRSTIGALIQTSILEEYWRPLMQGDHGGGQLSAPNGDRPLDPAGGNIFDYVEHRQFHRGT